MRSKFVLYSLFSSFGYQLVLTISNFIVIKLMISSYGSEINGLISSLNQVINYMNLVEAGLALTAIQSLYKPLSENNWFKVSQVLAATKKLYMKSGVLFLFLTIFIAFIYPKLINTNIIKLEVSSLIFVMAGGSVIEYFLNGKLRVLLMADQKSYVINIFQTISLSLSTISKMILISNGFHYILVQTVGTFALMLRYYLTKFYVTKKYPNITNDVTPFFEALDNRWSVLFHQIAGMIVFNSSLIIVSIYVGLKEASVYVVYNIVFSGLLTIITMFSKSTISSFGNLLYKEAKERIHVTFNRFQVIFFTFGIWLYTVAYLMVRSFIKLYTNGITDINYENFYLASLFTIVGILNMIRMPNNTLIEAAGHYRQTRGKAFIEAFLNLFFSLIFVNFLGIYGVLLGSIISYVYRSIDIIIYSSKNILEMSSLKTFKLIFFNISISLLLIFIFSFINLKISTWFDWILNSSIISILLGVTFIMFNNFWGVNFLNELKRILKV